MWLNIICMDMDIPTFGCAVFNPWYVGFISGLSSCEYEPLSSWLIVELFSLLWVKNCKWSYWKPFVCSLQYCAGLLCFVSWPRLQLWWYCVGCVPGRISMEDTSGIASWSLNIALHEKILFVLQSSEYISWMSPGGFHSDPTMYSARPEVDNIPNQPISWEVVKCGTVFLYWSW